MKSFILRFREIKHSKNSNKFLEYLRTLNPDVSFKSKKTNQSHIYTDILGLDLISLSLPVGSSYYGMPAYTSVKNGFVIILYKHKQYYIFSKDCEDLYFSS